MERLPSRRGSSPRSGRLRVQRVRRTLRRLSTHSLAAPALLIATLLTVGCASAYSKADLSFEAGAFPAAASGYESYLASQPSGPDRTRILFRLALMYLSPESSVHDLEKARTTFGRLVEEDPGSPFSSLVAYAFYLERRVGELGRDLKTAEEELGGLRHDLEQAAETRDLAQDELRARDQQLELRGRKLNELTETLEGLRTEVQDRKQQMRRLAEALELLKEIDLKR